MATDNNTAQHIQEDSVQAGDLSKTLKEYRSAADLDVEQVAEALCLPPSSVQALENEEFNRLPEPPYVRGYLRSYARLADRDPATVISIYEKLRGSSNLHDSFDKRYPIHHHENHNPPAPIISPARFKLGLLALLLLLLVLLTMLLPVSEWSSSIWDKFSQQNTTTVKNETASPIPEQTLTGDMPNSLPPPVEDGSTDQTTAAGEPSSTEASSSTLAAEGTAATSEDAPLARAMGTEENSTTGADTENQGSAETASIEADTGEQTPAPVGDTSLKMVFSDEVWLRIQDNEGNRLYEALNQAGSEKEVTLSKPMKFRVGNAQGLKLFVNGTEMDINEYIKGSIATFSIE